MTKRIAKPFLKWAGGKTQLINDIEKALPKKIYSKKFTYIEPFVGSGAVLFWTLNNFPNLQKAVINDINEDLINTYRTIASKPEELISILQVLQKNSFFRLQKFRKFIFRIFESLPIFSNKYWIFNTQLSFRVVHYIPFINAEF